jgi:hypothetical protein
MPRIRTVKPEVFHQVIDRKACEHLIAAVKSVDGEPGPEEVVVFLDGPSREAVKRQERAEGVGDPL